MNTYKWLLKREFWEHKGGFFWAPAVVGAAHDPRPVQHGQVRADRGGRLAQRVGQLARARRTVVQQAQQAQPGRVTERPQASGDDIGTQLGQVALRGGRMRPRMETRPTAGLAVMRS